jgi:hypothetical protein
MYRAPPAAAMSVGLRFPDFSPKAETADFSGFSIDSSSNRLDVIGNPRY